MSTGAIKFGASSQGLAFVYVSDRERALGFYRDTLGLAVVASDPYGDYLQLPGALLRLTVIPDLAPHAHPVLGFDVPDLAATAATMRQAGIDFDIFEGLGQDAEGVWTSPDGGKIAFFKDLDGNALMLSQR